VKKKSLGKRRCKARARGPAREKEENCTGIKRKSHSGCRRGGGLGRSAEADGGGGWERSQQRG
jgi:hypothetical protein